MMTKRKKMKCVRERERERELSIFACPWRIESSRVKWSPCRVLESKSLFENNDIGGTVGDMTYLLMFIVHFFGMYLSTYDE
mmetsp:Transcript_21735/g.24391  ORF Transcript_21735/g.24391 Transcript_21735/m.24391 type:complete len:81 (+) Transcript_21735:440-682(+)